jgi:hypothetical protein
MAVPLVLGALRCTANQAAMRFAGQPRVDATQYVRVLAPTSHDTRLRPRNRARATIAIESFSFTLDGKGTRSARPPAPFTTARRWKRGASRMAECRPEPGPSTRRGIVSDAGRGGRWAALVAMHNQLHVELPGKLDAGDWFRGDWHRERLIGEPGSGKGQSGTG